MQLRWYKKQSRRSFAKLSFPTKAHLTSWFYRRRSIKQCIISIAKLALKMNFVLDINKVSLTSGLPIQPQNTSKRSYCDNGSIIEMKHYIHIA